MPLETAYFEFVKSSLDKAVFEDAILDVVAAEVGAQLGVVRNGYTLVVDDDESAALLDLRFYLFDLRGLLLSRFRDLLLCHFYLRKNSLRAQTRRDAIRLFFSASARY